MENVKQEQEAPVYFDVIESVGELLDSQIDKSQYLFGDGWLERGTFGVLVGPSGVGKSVAAMQMAIQAAVGGPVFGINVTRPLRPLMVQAEDSKNDRIKQVQCTPAIVGGSGALQKARDIPVHTTNRRGAELFAHLEYLFTDEVTGEVDAEAPDLYILNPAFAFFPTGSSAEDSSDVGYFLRKCSLS